MSENLDKIDNLLESGAGYTLMADYNEALSSAKDDEDLDYIRCNKIRKIIDFTGTYNFDATDILTVLKLLAEMRCTDGNDPIISDESRRGMHNINFVSKTLNISENYAHLIFCVLDYNGLIEYGSSLYSAFITDLGLDMLNPEYTKVFRTAILKKHPELEPHEAWDS